MNIDKLIEGLNINPVENLAENKRAEIEAIIKQWEADPEAQKRWREAGKKAAKIKNSPYWRTHPQDYMRKSFKSIEEIYQDLKESES